jgi:hypothetical protein
VQTVLKLEPSQSRALSAAERQGVARDVVRGDAHVYVEHSLVGKLDMEPLSGASMSRMANDPNLVWERVELKADVGQPTALASGSRRFDRVTARVLADGASIVAYVVRQRTAGDPPASDTGAVARRRAS